MVKRIGVYILLACVFLYGIDRAFNNGFGEDFAVGLFMATIAATIIFILANKGKKLQRVDLNSTYITNEYRKALTFTEGYLYIDGVDALHTELQEEHTRYVEKRKALIQTEQERENANYEKWRKVHEKKRMIFMAAVLIMAIGALVHGAAFTSGMIVLSIILYFAGIVGFVVYCVFNILELIYGKRYKDYVQDVTNRIDNDNRAYRDSIQEIHDKVDDKYLLSLDPAERQVVLMRRDQERQHRELVEEQRRHQARMEAEQRKMREAQERTLEIEEERLRHDKERWGNNW